MNNCRFFINNLLASSDATVTASSTAAGYPLSNLTNGVRSDPHRTTGATGEYHNGDLGAKKTFNYFLMMGGNLSQSAEVRAIASDSPGGSDLLDVTYPAWEPAIGFGEGGHGEHLISGYLTDEEFAIYSSGYFRVYYLTEAVSARYCRFLYTDPANTVGFIELAHLEVGRYFEPSRNFRLGNERAPIDLTTSDRTEGGQTLRDINPQLYTHRMEFRFVPRVEVNWGWVEMLRRVGKKRPFGIDPCPDGTPGEKFFKRGWYAQASDPGVVDVYGGRAHVSLDLIEEL